MAAEFNLSVWLIGALLSIPISIALIFFKESNPKLWTRLQFRRSNLTEQLTGEAKKIYGLKGLTRDEAAREEEVLLSSYFPAPLPDEASSYKIEDCTIKVNAVNKVYVEGVLRYSEGSVEMLADFDGSGPFVKKDSKNWDGYCVIEVVCKQRVEEGKVGYEWTATYFLRRIADKNRWDGFWMLFSRNQPQIAKFGSIRLLVASSTLRHSGFLGLLGRSTKSARALIANRSEPPRENSPNQFSTMQN